MFYIIMDSNLSPVLPHKRSQYFPWRTFAWQSYSDAFIYKNFWQEINQEKEYVIIAVYADWILSTHPVLKPVFYQDYVSKGIKCYNFRELIPGRYDISVVSPKIFRWDPIK